ncbi:MAG TPA: S8 family serine peptidase, partial [Verrucomicrobiae bacterium]|nr:S8 family serine peptidase [Verrucomicrobiae bacterium]
MVVKQLIGLSVILMLFLAGPTNSVSAEPKKIHVVVLHKKHSIHTHAPTIKSNIVGVTKSFKIIDGYAADLSPTEIEQLKNDPDVASVDYDLQVKALDSSADTQIRANQIWQSGNTGQGIPIAILDTGIDTSHPEFSGRILQCHSELTGTDTCEDQYGHGTHVAGIAAASGINPLAKGVAPQASLYIDQVLDSTGGGTISSVIAGIDWAVTNHAKVISMSFGTNPLSTTQSNCDSALPSLTEAINNAVASGVTVVAAAGNSGSSGIGAPGCISSTIAVGAVNSTNVITSFSSVGGAMTDHGISAPGVNILSSVPTSICTLCNSSGYASLSGTSMATPSVAGMVALMIKSNPSLSPASIKSALFADACSINTVPNCPTGTVPNQNYGFGRVDTFVTFGSTEIPPPSISLSPNTGTVGSLVTVTGKGFTIGSTITLKYNGTTVVTTPPTILA